MATFDRESLLAEMRDHEREIERLSWEIWWLDEVAGPTATSASVREQIAREVRLSHVQLTRRRIDVALLSSRLSASSTET